MRSAPRPHRLDRLDRPHRRQRCSGTSRVGARSLRRKGGLLVVVFLGLMLASCSSDEARFDLAISGDAECLGDAFPFEPGLFAIQETFNGAMIRMQLDSRSRVRNDAFYVTVVSEDPVLEGCVPTGKLSGASIPVGPEQCAQAYFRLNDSCRSEYLNPHVVGTITFDTLGFDRGDMVEGSVSGQLFDVKIDEVAGEPVQVRNALGAISGDFSFEVRVGPAYQIFSAPADHNPEED